MFYWLPFGLCHDNSPHFADQGVYVGVLPVTMSILCAFNNGMITTRRVLRPIGLTVKQT